MTNFRFYLVLSLSVLFVLFIWPTPWRYEHDPNGYLVRINSITGTIDWLIGMEEGWVRHSKTEATRPAAPVAEAPAAAPASAPAAAPDAAPDAKLDDEFIRRYSRH